MREHKKNNKTLYYLIAAFVFAIATIELSNIELWKPKEGDINPPLVRGALPERTGLTYEGVKNFERKENSELKYIDGDFCEGYVSVAMDKGKEFGPTFKIKYSNTLDLNNISEIEVSTCIKQLDNSLGKASTVVSISNEEDEIVFWHNLAFKGITKNNWEEVTHKFTPNSIPIGDKYIVKVFVWNPEKERFLVDNFKVKVKQK